MHDAHPPGLGTADVIRADSRNLPLADDSVDLVVTSPPYFALRSYQDGGEHYAGQIGDEPTPDEFVSSLLEVTRECMRVLKPSGSLWVNLGDKYAGGVWENKNGKGASGLTGAVQMRESGRRDGAPMPRAQISTTARPKSLIGIPWRYALRCIDDLGLILRAEVIWSKPNGLPESVTDRVRRSHETWFHFTLEPRYFSAIDEIREAYAPGTAARYAAGYNPRKLDAARPSVNTQLGGDQYDTNPLGKLPGSVWIIPTEPLRVPDHLGIDHFAAFPTAFPKRIIQGWSPAGICVECGQERSPGCACTNKAGDGMACGMPFKNPTHSSHPYGYPKREWCPGAYGTAQPTRPAVVLDPFGGTGTTAMVAKALGRHGISVDMSADYCRLAEWRTNDRDQLAKVLGIAKVDGPTQTESLFDLLGGGAA